MGYDCICGGSIGYRGHYCEGMKLAADQRIIDLLTEIANSLSPGGAYTDTKVGRYEIDGEELDRRSRAKA